MYRRLHALMLLALTAAPSAAHEFWIAPQRGAVGPGETVTADFMVGRMLEGVRLPYLTPNIALNSVDGPGGRARLSGLEGDMPAIVHAPEGEGLHVYAHQTRPLTVAFDDWDAFVRYLAEEGLPEIADAHRARGLPAAGFRERYIRCAKALVQVGAARAEDADRPVGLPLELTLEGNPYAGPDAVIVRLTRNGAPVAGRRITLFLRNGETRRLLLETDEAGRAVAPLSTPGFYLLNAVDLQPIAPDTAAPDLVWESHWASLTFAL